VTRHDPREVYEQRRAGWQTAIARGESRHLRIANLRLAAVALFAVLAWLVFVQARLPAVWILLPVVAFFALLIVHARVLNAQDRARRALHYYERGLARLDGSWMGTGADGARFLDGHSYARDLDLFGQGSLFQLINTARTESGEETLADWLRMPASIPDILARQQAVAELRERLDFREALAIFAAEARVTRTGALATWTAVIPAGFSITHARLLAVCAAVTLVAVALLSVGLLPLSAVVGWVAVQASVALTLRHRMRRVLRGVDAATYDLGLLSGLLSRIEREPFSSPLLQALHRTLAVGGALPSQKIARLQLFIAARDSLRNEFVRPFALLFVVRSQAAVAIDRWHAAHRAELAAWLSAVGAFEALASLATYAFEHPADPFPVLLADGPHLEAAGLAHPLIRPSVAVPNDVALGGAHPRVLIVSGSNMSGKSTLLRAVGANVVLALSGAPVRATAMTLSPLVLGATMRVEDSLQEGQSRFYAEILRIRDIVATARGAVPMLFLLDEILHGTNSHDRRIGAEAIVKALVEAGAIGFVTTHDLALTMVSATFGVRAHNVHFEDRIEDGRMLFDYRMRDGVVERSNALELMRAVGLDV
jgi:hypothetical protein